jgi:flavin-dependent dehydrogenase
MERAAHLELEAAGNVIFHGRTRALGLLTERRAVTGVAVKDEANGQQRNMSADLVVDAMGASSLVPRWLRAQRLPAPSTTREPLGRWFASLVVERPEKDFQGNSFWLTLAVGDQTKGGVVTPVDSDHWQISVSGFEDDHRPRTFAQVKEHARSLDDGGTITDVLDLVDTPLDQEIHPAYRLGVLTVADDAQISLPRGLVRIGDAVRRLDPIWGQGMAIASGEARILGALVARHGDNLEAIGAANAQAATALAAKAREASDLITDATSEDPQATAEGVAASPETYKYFMEQLHMTDVEPLQLIAT